MRQLVRPLLSDFMYHQKKHGELMRFILEAGKSGDERDSRLEIGAIQPVGWEREERKEEELSK